MASMAAEPLTYLLFQAVVGIGPVQCPSIICILSKSQWRILSWVPPCHQIFFHDLFHPQTKLWEGNVFTLIFLFRGEGVRGTIPPGPHPQDHTSPRTVPSPRWLANGRYASYWNAFLFFFSVCFQITVTNKIPICRRILFL